MPIGNLFLWKMSKEPSNLKRRDFEDQMRLAQLNDDEPISKFESIFISVHGIHGEINHNPVSNSQWGAMDLATKFRFAKTVTVENPTITLYRNVVGSMVAGVFRVTNYTAAEPTSLAQLQSLEQCHYIAALSSAVWLRDNAGITCFQLCGAAHFLMRNTGLRKHVEDPQFKEVILRMCQEIQDLLTGDQVFEATPQMMRTLNPLASVNNLVEDGSRLVTNLNDTVDDAKSFLSALRVDYDKLLTQITSVLGNYVVDKTCNVLLCANLFVDCIFALLNQSIQQITSCIIRLCVEFGVVETVIKNLLTFLGRTPLFNPNQVRQGGEKDLFYDCVSAELVPQGGGDGGILALIAAVVGVCILKFMPGDKQINSVVNSMRSFNVFVPFVNNLSRLFEFLPKLLPGFVQEWFNEICPAEGWTNVVNDEFLEWTIKCDTLLKVENENRIRHDDVMQAELVQLRIDAMRFMRLGCTAREVSGKLFGWLSRILKRLEEFQGIVDSMAGGRGRRVEPYCIGITGPSFIGKSYAMETIAALLAPDGWPRSNLSYTRCAGNDFWDAYTNQFAVYYDDFGQVIGAKDFSEIFGVVNNVAYMPNMASLENPTIGKKGTFFDSKLVILSSNSASPACENEIRCPFALQRRRRLLLQCEAVPRYRNNNGSCNWDIVPADVKARFEHLQWKMLDPIVGQRGPVAILDRWLTSREMFMIIKQKFNQHLLNEQAALANSESSDFIAELRAENVELVPQGGQSLLDLLSPKCSLIREKAILLRADVLAELKNARDKWLAIPDNSVIAKVIEKLQGWSLVIGAVAGLVALWKYSSSSQEECIPQAGLAYDVNTRVRAKRIKHLRPQGATCDLDILDPNGVRVTRENIATSMVYIRVHGPKYINHMSGFCVGFDYILLPRHLFLDNDGEYFVDNVLIEIFTPNAVKYDTLFVAENLHILRDSFGQEKDLALYKFGPRLPPRRSKLSLFVRDDELDRCAQKPAILVSMKDGILERHPTMRIKPIKSNTVCHYKVNPECTSPNGEFFLCKGWVYQMPTAIGDCGGVLCVMDASSSRKIAGVHIAAQETHGNGVAELITFEMLDAIIKVAPPSVITFPLPTLKILDQESVLIQPQGNFDLVGTLAPSERLRLPDKTAIVPSLFFEKFGPHKMEPAVLSPKDPRLEVPVSPLQMGVSKYGQQCKPMRWDLLNEIVDDMYRELSSPELLPLRLLTEDEAINGIRGRNYCDAINMQSSAGWPYKLTMKAGESKAALFGGQAPNYFVSDPELRRRIDEREKAARLGMRVPSAFVDCLKDEKRSLEKIRAGKTRVFAIAPVDLVIVVRKYLLAFAARLHDVHTTCFSALGVNCDSFEWATMYEYLVENSSEGFAGDFGKFDGTLSADCMYAACLLVNRLYNDGEENQLARLTLFNEFIHTYHIAMDCVYVCSGGNPSGNPMTIVLNTLVNEMYLRYAWLSMASGNFSGLVGYHSNVRTQIVGDDNWISVKPAALEFYNLFTVSAFFKTLGLEYLSPSKEQELAVPYAPVKDWSFLKHRCNKVDQICNTRFLAAIEWDVIIEMLNWTKKDLIPYEAISENVVMAMYFAFGHGRLRFEWLRSRLCQIFERLELHVPPMPTWRELREKFLKENGFSTAWVPQGSVIPCVIQGDSENVLHQDSAFGIALTEQTAPVIEAGTRGAMSTSDSRARMQMQDIDWGLNEMVMRENFVATVPWSTGDAVNTRLAEYQLPRDMLITNTVRVPFNRFVFWRGNPRIRFQVNGTRFHCGRVICYYVPLADPSWLHSWHGKNKAAQTSVQHVFLDPSVSTSGELKIPFVNFKNYLNIVTPNGDVDYLGYVVISVFNKLQVSTGASASVNISVYMAIDNPEFKVPNALAFTPTMFAAFDREKALLENATPESRAAVEATIAGSNFGTSADLDRIAANVERAKVKALEKGFKGKDQRLEGFLGPSAAGQEKELFTAMWDMLKAAQGDSSNSQKQVELKPQGNTVSSKVTNVFGRCADVTMPIETIGDKFDTKSKVTAMDKVNIPVQPQYMVLKPVGYMNHSENVEFLNKMTLHPSALNLVTPEHFGTNQDEMDFKYIFSLPTFLGSFIWGVGNLSQEILYSGKLGPMGLSDGTFGNGNPSTFTALSLIPPQSGPGLWQPTLMEYATIPFSFWRGGFRIYIDIVATAFHTGRLWLGVHYGNINSPVPVSIDSAYSQYGANIELGPESHHFTYEIPFLSSTDYKRVVNGANVDTLFLPEYFMGQWSLRVINPLMVAEGAPATIDVNIFVSGADDYEVAGLHMNNVSLLPLQAQGAQDLTAPNTMSESERGIPIESKAQRPVRPTHFGETYASIKDIIRRYAMTSTRIGSGPSTGYTETNAAACYIQLPFKIDIGTEIMRGTMGHFARMYCVWRGSVRFKVMWEITGTTGGVAGSTLAGKVRSVAMLDTAVDSNTAGDFSTDVASLMFGMGSNINSTGSSTGNSPYYANGVYKWPAQIGEPYSFVGVEGASLPSWRSPPVDWARYDVPYHEIEVPFCTLYNVLNTYIMDPVILDTLNHLRLVSPGTLWLGIETAQNLADTADLCYKSTVFTAAGDDFRLGLLLGPPSVQLNALNVGGIGVVTSFSFDNY